MVTGNETVAGARESRHRIPVKLCAYLIELSPIFFLPSSPKKSEKSSCLSLNSSGLFLSELRAIGEMKKMYEKGKGRIHPSPAQAASIGSDSTAVLGLMPAAIAAIAANLNKEDKVVLAYLIARSIVGNPTAAAAEAGKHRAAFDCGCFECYTSFWSRWDRSPEREIIHTAIEAFEEHLARSERREAASAGVSSGRGRRRDRRTPAKGGVEKSKITEEFSSAEKMETGAEDARDGPAAEEMSASGELSAWPHLVGLLNPRRWSHWIP